ncbi:SBBP repeat-containing protein [Myxococcaceae bacterium GXIMD 01537]
MRVAQKLRSTLLAGAMILLAIPGCQGEEPAAEPAPSAESAQDLGCYMSLVPPMTSNTAPSGSAGSSGAFSSNYEAWQAFDSSLTSMWISAEGQTSATLSYQWTDGRRRVTKYALRYSNGSITTRAPKSWVLYGWNGQSIQPPVAVDTRTNETGWAGHERREYTVANPGAYSRYYLVFSEDNDPSPGIVVISLGNVEFTGCAPEGLPTWTRLQGAASKVTRVNDLTGDPEGRSYAVGMSNGAVPGPLVGGQDAFLHAYDSSGSVLWTRQMGVPGNLTAGYAVARNRVSGTTDDIYVGGFTSGALAGGTKTGTAYDAFVTKYNASGTWAWTRQMGVSGADTEAYGLGVDPAGNAFLAGATKGSLDGNTRIGISDAFVTKYDSAGTKQWTRTVGVASARTHGRRASADASGNVYVAGWTDGALDGNVKVGPQDFFITKYNAAGVKQWTRQYGAAAGSSYLYGSALDAAGNLYVTGYSYGSMDGSTSSTTDQTFLARYDASGTRQWVRQFGLPNGAWGTSLAINASGIYVGGIGSGDLTNPSSPDSMTHSYIAKYDTSGNRLYLTQQDYARTGSTEQYSHVHGISVDDSGYAYLGGFTEGDLGTATRQGIVDGFVVKLRLP